MADQGNAAYGLSPDRMTLVVKRRAPGGVLTTTLHRQKDAGPFTDADIAKVLSFTPSSGWEPGQRNRSRRVVTRFGTLWTHVMTGPPTWWLPKVKRDKDGTFGAGWLRLAVVVRFDHGAADA